MKGRDTFLENRHAKSRKPSSCAPSDARCDRAHIVQYAPVAHGRAREHARPAPSSPHGIDLVLQGDGANGGAGHAASSRWPLSNQVSMANSSNAAWRCAIACPSHWAVRKLTPGKADNWLTLVFTPMAKVWSSSWVLSRPDLAYSPLLVSEPAALQVVVLAHGLVDDALQQGDVAQAVHVACVVRPACGQGGGITPSRGVWGRMCSIWLPSMERKPFWGIWHSASSVFFHASQHIAQAVQGMVVVVAQGQKALAKLTACLADTAPAWFR